MVNAPKYFVLFLNSHVSHFYLKNTAQTLANGIRHTKPYIERLPIPMTKNDWFLNTFADHILYLMQNRQNNHYFNEIIGFETQLKEALVYSLYFPEMVDSSVSSYLFTTMEHSIQTLNYETWIRLYWKYVFREITKKEQDQFKTLRKTNDKIVYQCYQALKFHFYL